MIDEVVSFVLLSKTTYFFDSHWKYFGQEFISSIFTCTSLIREENSQKVQVIEG